MASLWRGVFSADVQHRVMDADRARIVVDRGQYGLAACGAACVRASKSVNRKQCETCFPPEWPTEVPADDSEGQP